MDNAGSFNRNITPTRPSVVKNSTSNSGQPNNTTNSGHCPHHKNECAEPIRDRSEIEQREQNTAENKPLGLNSINSNDSDHKVTSPINIADETSNMFKQNSRSPLAGTETANKANETHSHANETHVRSRCYTDCPNISHINVPRGNINPGEMTLTSNSVEDLHVSIDVTPFISNLLANTRENLHHAQNTLAHLERQIQIIDNVFNSASSNISVDFTRANERQTLTSVEQSCPKNTANRDTVADITQNSYVRKPLNKDTESKPAALQTSNLDSNKDDEVVIIPHSGFTEIIIDLDSDSEDNSKNRVRKLLTIIHPIKEDHQTVASTQTTGPATSLAESQVNLAAVELVEATASSRSEINEVAGTAISDFSFKTVQNGLTSITLSEASQGKAVIESAESTVSSQPDNETPSEINKLEKTNIRGSRPSTNVVQNVGSCDRLIPNGLRNSTPAVPMSSNSLAQNQIASCAAETNSKSVPLHNKLENQQREQDTTEKRKCLPSDSCQLTKDSFDRNKTREPASLNNASERILQSTYLNGVEKPLYTLSSSLNPKTHEAVSVSEVHPAVSVREVHPAASVIKVHPSTSRAVFPGFTESGQAAPQTSNSGSKKDEDDVIFVPPSGSVIIDLDSDTEENSKNNGELTAGNALDEKPIILDTSIPSSSLQDFSEMPAMLASGSSVSLINNASGPSNKDSLINNGAEASISGSVCDDEQPFDLEFEYQRRLAEIKKENSCKGINYESDDSDTSDSLIIIENCSTVYDVEGSESTDLDDEPLSKRLCALLQSSVGTVRKVKKKRHSKRHHKNNRENELSKYQIVTRSRSRKLRTDTEEY